MTHKFAGRAHLALHRANINRHPCAVFDQLTDKQHQILELIAGSTTQRGYPPSVGELAAHVELSKSTVHHHLSVLIDQGLIVAPDGKARALSIRTVT